MQGIEKLLCDACENGTFKTKEFEEFTKILGLQGKCVLNPKNVLETYVKQQVNTMSEEAHVRNIKRALEDPEVKQNKLSEKIDSHYMISIIIY